MRLFVRLLALFTSFSLLVGSASADDITLTWNQSTETDLEGYRVWFGTQSGDYTDVRDYLANDDSATIADLTGGVTYYFVVTAYNTEGEQSLPSNEVSAMAGTPTPTPTPTDTPTPTPPNRYPDPNSNSD
jgi:fibronectin type 3 domain-containing protein